MSGKIVDDRKISAAKRAFAEYVAKKRVAAGMDMLELAQQTQINISTVSRYEKGEILPQYKNIRILAAALKVDAEELGSLVEQAREVLSEFSGFYATYQWSFLANQTIIKTVINIGKKVGRSKHVYEERFLNVRTGNVNRMDGVIEIGSGGLVQMRGIGVAPYKETDHILFRNYEDENGYMRGVVIGFDPYDFFPKSSIVAIRRCDENETPSHCSIDALDVNVQDILRKQESNRDELIESMKGMRKFQ